MEEIILLRSSSNSRNERAPRTEPLGTVAVSVPEIETIAFEPGRRVVERSPTRNSEAQAGDPIGVKGDS